MAIPVITHVTTSDLGNANGLFGNRKYNVDNGHQHEVISDSAQVPSDAEFQSLCTRVSHLGSAISSASNNVSSLANKINDIAEKVSRNRAELEEQIQMHGHEVLKRIESAIRDKGELSSAFKGIVDIHLENIQKVANDFDSKIENLLNNSRNEIIASKEEMANAYAELKKAIDLHSQRMKLTLDDYISKISAFASSKQKNMEETIALGQSNINDIVSTTGAKFKDLFSAFNSDYQRIIAEFSQRETAFEAISNEISQKIDALSSIHYQIAAIKNTAHDVTESVLMIKNENKSIHQEHEKRIQEAATCNALLERQKMSIDKLTEQYKQQITALSIQYKKNSLESEQRFQDLKRKYDSTIQQCEQMLAASELFKQAQSSFFSRLKWILLGRY